MIGISINLIGGYMENIVNILVDGKSIRIPYEDADHAIDILYHYRETFPGSRGVIFGPEGPILFY